MVCRQLASSHCVIPPVASRSGGILPWISCVVIQEMINHTHIVSSASSIIKQMESWVNSAAAEDQDTTRTSECKAELTTSAAGCSVKLCCGPYSCRTQQAGYLEEEAVGGGGRHQTAD